MFWKQLYIFETCTYNFHLKQKHITITDSWVSTVPAKGISVCCRCRRKPYYVEYEAYYKLTFYTWDNFTTFLFITLELVNSSYLPSTKHGWNALPNTPGHTTRDCESVAACSFTNYAVHFYVMILVDESLEVLPDGKKLWNLPCVE